MDEVTQAPINMNAIVLQIEAASERDQMWHRLWKALRALNYHNTNFVDQDGPWTLADFIAYAGEVCGFKPDDDASARHRHQAKRDTRGRMEWRDIESAPKACHVLAARFNEDCGEWQMQVTLSPPIYPFTHWMPLPPAPTPQEARHD